MTHPEAITIRQQQLQGVAVPIEILDKALDIIKTGKADPETKSNPWGLNKRQADAMTAVIKYGRAKTAARAMGLSHKTLEVYFYGVRKKMGVNSLLQAAVAWDRYLHEQVEM